MRRAPSTTCSAPGEDPGARDDDGARERAVPVGGRALDPGEEAAAGADAVDLLTGDRTPYVVGERARHPDAVLVLGKPVVLVDRREGTAGQQVVLVGRIGEAAAHCVDEPRLPPFDRLEHGDRLRARVWPEVGLARVRADAERDHTDGRQPREPVEDAEHRVVECVAVVQAGADDHLTVHLDAGVEQRGEPAEAGRAAAVAQETGAEIGVGRVDADVERAETLGDDALEVGFGEAGQRGEVAVQERQPVVVVLEVEGAPHPFRQLVDEAERAVVVTRPHPVEHRARELDAERLPRSLLHREVPLEPAATQLELDERLVGLELVPDDVAHRLAVEAEDLVAGREPSGGRRRTGHDRHHTGGRHAAMLLPESSASRLDH